MPPCLWRVVERRLAREVPAAHLPSLTGDLLEDYERRAASHGRVEAEIWLARESLSLLAAYRGRAASIARPSRSPMDKLRQDVVHAWRSVRARPAASAATVAVLMLGIGLVSAVFALADPFLLRPLPYDRPHELVLLSLRTQATEGLPTVAAWSARQGLFADLATAGTTESEQVLAGPSNAVFTLNLQPVSSNYFRLLGVAVTLPEDWRSSGTAGETPVVLTSEAKRRLFSGGRAFGQFLRRDEVEPGGYRVAGELPSTFVDPFARATRLVDGFVPLGGEPLIVVEVTPGGGSRVSYLEVLARLQPGVEPSQVEAALTTASAGSDERSMSPSDGVLVAAERLGERTAAGVRPLALGALAVGVLVMVVCAANVANLLLARGAARRREFAAREALGASAFDVGRLVLVELALLTSAGVALGIVVARLALATVSLVIPVEYTLLGTPAITGRVMALAGLCGVVVMLAGVIPAWAAWRVRPQALFTQTSALEARGVRMLRFGMTAAQTALAVVLLVGAALLARSYVNLMAQDPGYDGDVMAVRVRYPSDLRDAALQQVVNATLERLRRLPGVDRVAVDSGPLVDGVSVMAAGRPITIAGQPLPRSTPARSFDDGFLETVNARVLAGKLPLPAERTTSAIVSESLARDCCGSPAAAIGRAITDLRRRPFVVRAVIKDLFTTALDQPPGPVAYFPREQISGWPSYVLRAREPGPALLLSIEREIRAVAPLARVNAGATMQARLMQSIRDRSFATLIIVFFSIAAITISAAGIVGVVSFVVARRTREMAIRIAIGARPSQVRRLVAREAFGAAALGATVGLAGGAWLSRVLESLLYGLEPADPGSLAVALTIAIVLAAAAAWLPARRAMRLAPISALREE